MQANAARLLDVINGYKINIKEKNKNIIVRSNSIKIPSRKYFVRFSSPSEIGTKIGMIMVK